MSALSGSVLAVEICSFLFHCVVFVASGSVRPSQVDLHVVDEVLEPAVDWVVRVLLRCCLSCHCVICGGVCVLWMFRPGSGVVAVWSVCSCGCVQVCASSRLSLGSSL